MSVRITHIRKDPNAYDPYHGISSFRWINEQTQASGESTREIMYDWIVNKGGQAYVKEDEGIVYVYGAVSSAGLPFLRTAKDGKWTNNLLELPSF
jgi:hypothetical protein